MGYSQEVFLNPFMLSHRRIDDLYVEETKSLGIDFMR